MKKKENAKKSLDKIIALGKKKGFLTYEEVNDLLPEEIYSSEDIDRVLEMLGNEDIPVVEHSEEKDAEKRVQETKEDALVEQHKTEERFLPLDDPVKMYLKQMGSISLLSRKEEIDLAKDIEDAEEKFKQAVLWTKFARAQILSLADDIIEEKVNLVLAVSKELTKKGLNANELIKPIAECVGGSGGGRPEMAQAGGREKANLMLAELREEYEKANLQLRQLKRRHGKNAEAYASEKVKMLTISQSDVKRIIEKYAPGSADRVQELVFGTSLAMSAMMVPVTYAVSALSVAIDAHMPPQTGRRRRYLSLCKSV